MGISDSLLRAIKSTEGYIGPWGVSYGSEQESYKLTFFCLSTLRGHFAFYVHHPLRAAGLQLWSGRNVPQPVHIFLDNLCVQLPPALNPTITGMKTHQFWEKSLRILKMLLLNILLTYH